MQNFPRTSNDQVMIFNCFSALGTPTEVQSVTSYRTPDFLPAHSLGERSPTEPDPSTPFGYVEMDRQAQQIQELQTANGQLTHHRNTMANELHAALAANQLLVGEASASPTKAMLQSMVAEANRSAALTAGQRATMVRQMVVAEERIVQLDSWLALAQSQVGHCANTATSEKVLLNEALTEVDRLKRRVIELSQEIAETSRREAGKHTGEHIHELRTTLNRDHETRHIAFKAESDNIKQKSEKEIADQREQIRKLQNERTTQARDMVATSTQADFIRALRAQIEDLSGERSRYQRMADDYVSQLRTADDKAKQVASAHYTSQAEARHENDALRSNVSALTDAQQQTIHERESLASKVTQLQVEASTAHAGNEQMRTLNQKQTHEISQLNQQVQQIGTDANLRIGNMVERSVYEDALAAHTPRRPTRRKLRTTTSSMRLTATWALYRPITFCFLATLRGSKITTDRTKRTQSRHLTNRRPHRTNRATRYHHLLATHPV